MKKVLSISLVLMVFLAACVPSLGGSSDNTGNTGSTSDTGGDQNPPVAVATNTEQAPVVVAVTATSNQNANCRSGPGTVYDILGVFMSGETANVLGKNTNDGVWFKIQLADGTQCWVGDSVVTISGDVSTVAYLNAPPTPTAKPKPSWVGTWATHQGLSFTDPSWVQNFNIIMVMNGQGQITFNFTAFGYPYFATGTPSADGTYMEGFAQRSGGADKIRFRFYFVDSNSDQFQGQWYLESNSTKNGDWCGSRNGSSLPSPCRR
jgi:uncharacterized protein YraI